MVGARVRIRLECLVS